MHVDTNIKQVIVMRTDLNMRKGKMVAQGSHAALAFIADRLQGKFGAADLKIQDAWMYHGKTAICVRVDSEEELMSIYDRALTLKLTVYLVRDAGLTEFGGIPTYTCLGIGPNMSDCIDKVTGNLKLL